jgi:hypothetical protein
MEHGKPRNAGGNIYKENFKDWVIPQANSTTPCTSSNMKKKKVQYGCMWMMAW